MTEDEIAIEVVSILAAALKNNKKYKNVSFDCDNDSGEVIFTAPDGVEYCVKTKSVQMTQGD